MNASSIETFPKFVVFAEPNFDIVERELGPSRRESARDDKIGVALNYEIAAEV